MIWRCFSRDTRAVIPPQIDGLPVTELAPYAFSAHLDEAEFLRKLATGQLHILRSMLEEGAEGWIMSVQAQRENELEGLSGTSVRRGNELEGLSDASEQRGNELEGLPYALVRSGNKMEGFSDT